MAYKHPYDHFTGTPQLDKDEDFIIILGLSTLMFLAIAFGIGWATI